MRIAKPPGVTIEYHHDPKNRFHFHDNTPDDEWIAKVAGVDWIIFSHDRKWHNEAPVISAIKQYNAICFYLWGANESTWDKMHAFMLGFQRIIDGIAVSTKPYIFDVDRYGRLTRIPIP